MRNVEVRFHIDKETYAESEKARILAEVPKSHWHQLIYKRGLFEQGILSDDEASMTFVPTEIEDEGRQLESEDGNRQNPTSIGKISKTVGPYARSKSRLPPKTIKIKGDELVVRNWTGVLVQTAEWLIRQGKLTLSTPPIPSGPDRYIINIEREHRKNGVPWKGNKQLSNGLYIETNNDSLKSENYARRLLSYFGYDGDDIELVW